MAQEDRGRGQTKNLGKWTSIMQDMVVNATRKGPSRAPPESLSRENREGRGHVVSCTPALPTGWAKTPGCPHSPGTATRTPNSHPPCPSWPRWTECLPSRLEPSQLQLLSCPRATLERPLLHAPESWLTSGRKASLPAQGILSLPSALGWSCSPDCKTLPPLEHSCSVSEI